MNAVIADHTVFWWNERKPDQPSLWDSKIELSEKFFNEIIRCPVPLDLKTPSSKSWKCALSTPLTEICGATTSAADICSGLGSRSSRFWS